MLHSIRFSLGAAFSLALFLLVAIPLSASAAFWPGFPFAPAPADIVLELPIGPFNLCVKEVKAAGLRVQVPRPCKQALPPPPSEPTLTFTADPAAIEEGESSTLAWDSTNATSCEASNGWSGVKSVDGSQSVSPTDTTTYELTCSGPGGLITKSATVTVTDVPNPPTLTLVKTVVNDNGGQASANDFQAKIDGANVTWSATHTVTTGAHIVSEVEVFGYDAGDWGGDCAADGTITLAEGEDKTCTITNNDMPGTLHVVKVVVNDDAGAKVFGDFSFQIDGGSSVVFESDGQNDVTLNAGTYDITEVAVDGYTTSYNNCTDVVISNGGSATCTITNNDNEPAPIAPKLTVTKVVVNDDGGTKVIADFPLFVDGGGVTSGVENTYAVGAHTVSETADGGYTMAITGDCASDGTITLANGDDKTCTITNDDKQGTLHIVKVVVNDDGGAATADDFSFEVNGGAATAFEADGQNDVTVDAGTYDVTEVAAAGYTAGFQNCTDVVVVNGGEATCTITNDDNEPQAEADVVINEIAWMGSMIGETADADAEWIELKNRGSEAVNLTGWTLASDDGTPNIAITEACANTTVAAGGFFLLVRTPNSASLTADCTYTGALENAGELLNLQNASAVIINSVNGAPDWEIGGAPQKGNNTTKETAQRAADNTWFTAAPTPGA
ncbi:lamin tail domain-containing protein [Candidatus Kaiserbacteria bacterium]|nr:lamin tail domain-containing protein [Candidatus Kaiserbacteria bacterium]